MKTRLVLPVVSSLLLLCLPETGRTQFLEDALRLAEPTQAFSARSGAMGNAFVGVADDFSALYWNPAGIGQIRRKEFALGLTNISVTNSATFLGTTIGVDNSTTHLNTLGLVLPFPVSRGSLVFAAAYNRLVDYTSALSFSGYNAFSSIQPSLYDSDERYDLAWQLGLEEDSTLIIPITNNVRQSGDVFEQGNLGQWAFGGSIEVSRNTLVGLSLNVLTGSYRWERSFEETDPNNIHQGVIIGKNIRTDFQRLRLDETLTQDLTGFGIRFGLLYKLEERARFGLAIQSPYSIEITETYDKEGDSKFADATDVYRSPAAPTVRNTYGVNTSWLFSLGVSVNPVDFVTLAGDVDLTDFTQIEFDNTTNPSILRRNKEIRSTLQSTNNYRLGAEIRIPETGLQIRGGYGYKFSPYKDDASIFDVKSMSFGVGYLIDNTFLINATYVRSTNQSSHFNYHDSNPAVPDEALRTDEDISRTRIILTISHLF